MKPTQFHLIPILLILFFYQGVQADDLKVGFFSLSPHVYLNSQKMEEGPAANYLRMIAEHMGISNIAFSEYPLNRLLITLERNEIDAALALGKSPERETIFEYPESPFFNMVPAIVVNKLNQLNKIESIDDLLNISIATYPKVYLSPMMRNKNLKIFSLKTNDLIVKGYEMILRGHVDAFYSPDSYSLKYALKTYDYVDKLKLIYLPEDKTGLYTVFSKQSAKQYKKKYEEALKIVQQINSYEKIVEIFLSNVSQ